MKKWAYYLVYWAIEWCIGIVQNVQVGVYLSYFIFLKKIAVETPSANRL